MITTKQLKQALDLMQKYNAKDLIDGIDSKFRKLEILSDDKFMMELLPVITTEIIDYNDIDVREKVLTDFLANFNPLSLNTEQNKMNGEALKALTANLLKETKV